MSIQTLRIPQLGEGLHEAVLVEYLCQPGTIIRRDQPIYVMETDKATTEVECPVEGRLVSWLVEPGQVLPIGHEIGKIELLIEAVLSEDSSIAPTPAPHAATLPASASTHAAANHSTPATKAESSAASIAQDLAAKNLRLDPAQSELTGPKRHRADGVRIPPRTRRHMAMLGVTEQMDLIPVRGDKLLPEDVDRYVAAGLPHAMESLDEPASRHEVTRGFVPAPHGALAQRFATQTQPQSTVWYDEQELPKGQLTLNFRLLRGLQQVVPATAIIELNWLKVGAARELARQQQGPTGFMMMLWCVARSLAEHPSLRSTLVRDGRVLRTFKHVDLGVAVALPDDRLVTAVIPQADTLTQSQFWQVARERIALAKGGRDQANDRVTFTVSNIGTFGLHSGVPVVVPPAVATLALGAVEPRPVPDGEGWRFEPRATASLTFDHRVLNGLGAGRFLTDLQRRVALFELAE